MVAHSFPRWLGDVPGSFLLRLAEALVARGHQVAVVAPADRGKGGRVKLGGVELLQVRYAAAVREDLAYAGDMGARAKSPGGALTFYRLVRALRRGARDEASRIDADLVHAFWWVPGGWAASPLGLPQLISLMGTDVAMMRSLPGRVLARRVLSRATRLAALTTFLADEARRIIGRPHLAIERVPVPVDVDRFSAPAGPPAPRTGIVYLGRLTNQKRVHLLLDAVHAAAITAPVTIVGDGPARPELEAQVARLALRNVRFLGMVPDEDVPGLVRSAAVAAFLSEREGLGLAAAEAQMMGTPVVATTDGGGVLDLLTDGHGASVVAPTPQAIGAALSRLLADATAPDAAAAAGQRLRSELSPDGVAAAFERIYAQMA
jgi:glycosyltransferase involved in cell wall biosynthesis